VIQDPGPEPLNPSGFWVSDSRISGM